MCCTAKTMPRIVSVSSCTTVWLMRRRPRAFTVASCLGLSPMIDLVRVSLSFLLDTAGVLREVPVTAPARRVQILKPLDPAQGVHGGLEHVVGIVGAEGLGQDVLASGRLQDGTHGAPGNDSRAGHGRLEEDPAGAEVTGDLAGNRRLLERHEDQVLLGVLDGLA